MGYLGIGLVIGVIFYIIFLIVLIFNKNISSLIYEDWLEYTFLGDAAQYLFFPSERDLQEREDSTKLIMMTGVFISLHIGLAISILAVFTLIGPILAPFLLISIIIGPIVLYFNNKKIRRKILEREESLKAAKAKKAESTN